MRNMILGTDWWTDVDDVIALRLLARAHKSGNVRLLGVGINAVMEQSVASVRGFLTSELGDAGRDISIGLDKEATDFAGTKHAYQARLATLAPDVTNDDAEDAASMYVRLLRETKARGEKAEILEIGFLQVIVNAMEQDPVLFAQTVEHVWVMGGKWDTDGGVEHNFANNEKARQSANKFCMDCPVPVTFLGHEIGEPVKVGGNLAKKDILAKALDDYGAPSGRSAWDPLLVELALYGDVEKAGYHPARGKATVDVATGANHFKKSTGGKHVYVVKKFSDEYYRDRLNLKIATNAPQK